ncbi:MAG: hypothetical protein NPIRA03_33890 [Nitrospirales bacterium]|nr:MAG: hypothetical protein NPIRA03_33890 [Nitrospirales bacterium]
MALGHQGRMSVILVIMGLMGCVGQQEFVDAQQAAIGRGIVEGTKGYQQIQQEALSVNRHLRKVQGQVFKIEGAAYVVHVNDQIEARLPFDENTQIDRPAHVGDWIEALLDQSGRARIIRNIDGHISLE